MINKTVLPALSYSLLEELQALESYKHFYLAGGTSLALQLAHRESVDLDFFTPNSFTTAILSDFPKKYQAININNNSIEVFSEQTKVFFFRFAFPLFKPLVSVKNLRLASPIDIGLMKLLALQGRSTKKDYIDLYFIDKEVMKLEELLQIFEKHYPSESFNSYSSLKNLFDLESLEAQPMPKMFKNVEWQDCLESVTMKVSEYVRKKIV